MNMLSRRMMKLLITGAIVATMLLPALSRAANVPESTDPIKLAINDWTGQHITTHVAGEILKRMGYNVEYITAGYFPQLKALQDNTLTATLEIWFNTIGDHYNNAIASGNVEDIGPTGLSPSEGWLYPAYVEEKCSGLPDWKALKNCSELFATAETNPKGRLLDYPADWGGNNPERLRAFELDFVAIPAGSEGALIAEFKSAYTRKAPVLMMFWAPHWLHAEYPTRFVTFPGYDPACVEDPSWGINPKKTYDCAWLSGEVRKVAWIGMKDKWPTAYRLLKLFTVTNEIQIPLMKAIDVNNQNLVSAIKTWVDSNEGVWRPWVTEALK